jgi:DNA-directed RNA polymerase specialized sigma subunit
MNALKTAALAEQYLPFAMKLANKFARQYPFLRMEFESAAAYGVCRAAKYYNPTRGSFMTLAHLAIQRTLFACLEMERKKSPTSFRQATTVDTNGEFLDPVELLAAPEQPDSLVITELVEIGISAIRGRLDREIFTRYAQGETFNTLGKEMGITRQRASQQAKQAARVARLAIAKKR